MPDGAKNYFDPKVLAGISNLALRARWVVEGLMSGVHRSRSKGFSVEFEEHREYSPGDEIRRIDWKALGKFDRYFIKEYEDETNLRAYLLLDASASMPRMALRNLTTAARSQHRSLILFSSSKTPPASSPSPTISNRSCRRAPSAII